MKFALYLGNRGFFPERLIAEARREVTEALAALGIDTLCAPENLTRYGAVETAAEGRAFAAFLDRHRGEYDGVLLVLPNFGDENGASEALCDCGVPIYILAYPDELDKMDFQSRRDAFCGKLSIMDVFTQFNIPFTAWEPHTLHPASSRFAEEMRQFAAVCRIVRGMKRCRIGAIGARPTAFKTIRFDEVALQKKGVPLEDIALSVQETAFAMLTEVTERAMAHIGKREVLLGGGVAQNGRLRDMVEDMAHARGAEMFVPDRQFCRDNGAMIAWLGCEMHSSGVRMSVPDTVVRQRFRTDEVDVTWR